MLLVISEKPSVAQSLSKVLGATNRKDGYTEGCGYIVSWCVGHLVSLAPADNYDEKYSKWNYQDLPIVPTEWKYVVSSKTKKQFDTLKYLMNRPDVSEVINACDAGREGEHIFRLVYQKANCNKPIKRLWISSLEDKAIKNGFANLKDGKEYDNLFMAAQCRAKADWIVGINATRLFSVLYGQTLNIGRVMSPTLSMIVERDAKISTFKPEPFYTVNLTYMGFSMIGEKFKTKAQAEAVKNVCDGKTATIKTVEQKERSEKPPKLYDLTTLQREANKTLGFTAEQTLTYAQSLYEKKLITYPRTDSRYLSEDMESGIPALVATTLVVATAGFFMPKSHNLSINTKQVTDNSKVTDHHAIIPTSNIKGLDLQSLPFGERETLRLIAIRLLVAVSGNHQYSETVMTAKCGETVFTAKGKTVISDGFKAVQKLYKGDPAKDKSDEQTLPTVRQGDTFKANIEIKEGKTSPPRHFTDDTLLYSMENPNKAETDSERTNENSIKYELGTPATMAGILEKLIKTGLAERKGDKKAKHFVATHKGTALITVLPEQIASPLMTAEWEEKLSLVERGELSPEEFLAEIKEMTTSLVKSYEVIKGADTLFPLERESIGKCPRCGNNVTENKKGFCCENKVCGFAIWKENKFFTAKKKAVTKALVAELLKSGKVELKGCYSEKTGKSYDCVAVMEDTGEQFVNFKAEFGGIKK